MNDAMELVSALNEKLEREQSSSNRLHLGGSEIGHWCTRHLYYKFRWCAEVKHHGRMLRLFNRGHYEEPRFISHLESIGIDVICEDPKTGEQFTISDVMGHFGGSLDAIMRNVPGFDPKEKFLGEFKTYADKYFKQVVKEGVKKYSPQHYSQMQIYMYKKGLSHALYCAVNKNDDDLYFEYVELNKPFAQDLVEKAETIITTDRPPLKGSDDPTFYRCGPKWCEHRPICHKNAVPNMNCRTCVFADIREDKQWHCNHHDTNLLPSNQREGCAHHLFLPALINAEQSGASKKDHFISYTLEDGSTLRNGIDHTKSTDMQGKRLNAILGV